MKADRQLDDPAMDRIDRALGRPINPLVRTAMEYTEAEAGSAEAQALAASPHWTSGGVRGPSHWFVVTDEGRQALALHLISIGDRHAAYVVTHDAVDTLVAATSAGHALQRVWQAIARTRPDLDPASFAAQAEVTKVEP